MQEICRRLGMAGLALASLAWLASGSAAWGGQQAPGVGDTPQQAGPLATDLSPAMTAQDVARAMRKVGDWELGRARMDFGQDWTFAALYRGLLAAGESLPDTQYTDALMAEAKQFDWKLGPRQTEADDQAVGYVYLALYAKYHDAKMLAPTKEQFDRIAGLPDVCTESCPPWHGRATPAWWWCDALFMAPPVWAELARVTREKKYLDRMDQGWWATSKLLYDPQEHLYSRDQSYLNKHEANGKKVFWSRGNGWVMAGLALVLEQMPRNYPDRERYVQQFRQMAARVKSIQGADGLWRPGLLDAAAYPLPEVSGSAFFVYALAWGINHGVLDRASYLPAVRKGWAGLVAHIYADGRLGCIQPIGSAPDAFKPQSSYVYGVGAFLLAGSQVRDLARSAH